MHTLNYENSTENIKAVKVEPLENYRLRVFFSNGETRVYNAEPLLKYKMFIPLKNEAFFAKATVKYNTVVWNEKIDIDPEDLYWNGEK
ncbi:MAG: DUF2442 domain-containing protein [Chitinivibrionia bacterium]|nr:DUF2442 domain-containing protein [Chitinivibrionia bacterium]